MILKTPRLKLRPFKVEDTEDFNELATDPQVTEFLTWESHTSMEQTLNSIQTRFMTNPNIFCIELKEEKKCLGCIDIRIDSENNKAGFGYVINRNYWNKGYMTETLSSILNYIFNTLNINKVESSCYVGNEGSGKVMEKCGMILEGTQKESLIIKGKVVDVIHYGITKQEFIKLQTLFSENKSDLLEEILR